MTVEQTVVKDVSGGWVWLRVHEKVVIAFLAFATVLYVADVWINHHYDVAKANATAATQALESQQEINKTLQQNYAQLQAQTQQINAQLQAQNVQLAQQTASAIKQAAAQQAQDFADTNSQLASRLDQLTSQQNIQSGNNGVGLTHQQAVVTAQDLEQLPVLKQEVQDDNQIHINDNNEIVGLDKELDSCNNVVKAGNNLIEAQKTACNAQIKELKAGNLKSKLKWTFFGFLTGVVTGLFGGHAL